MPSREATNPPVVLVADDEAMIREFVCRLMRREGYQVLPASDGEEALQLSRRFAGTIHLAITDMDMPRLNGSELCSRLRAERPGIRVLVMSGGGVTRVRRELHGLPVLPKPFDFETLKAVVGALLEGGRGP